MADDVCTTSTAHSDANSDPQGPRLSHGLFGADEYERAMAKG
jgi:hypothetical protein